MAVNLNKTEKQEIINRAVRDSMAKRRASLKAKREKLADQVYAKIMNCGIQKLIDKLPDGFLPVCSSIDVQLGRSADDAAKRCVKFQMSEQRRIPHKAYRSWYPIISLVLCSRYDELLNEKEEIKADEQELKTAITGVVMPCRTLKQLEDRWPTGSKYIPDSIKQKDTKNLPAVLAEELDTLIAVKSEG